MKGSEYLTKYKGLARQVVAEGAVLLKNDQQVLPLHKGCKVASFGRSQLHYVKSGTGSGGLVNTEYVISILDALKASPDIILNDHVLKIYEEWVSENPFDAGCGWATEPWSQEEMPLTEELVQQAALDSEVALVTIARTAGEEKDNSATEGSYLLSAEEERMLEMVCRIFEKTVVLLNTGNIIDMKWVQAYNPSAVLYVWQGGQEGGDGVLDVLTGIVSPSGKLPDTIAYDVQDYPSTEHFGDDAENIYVEDIYVGYRYFETFAKEKVLYPFGFGLSYTSFDINLLDFDWNGEEVSVRVAVKNTGKRAGKEVIQLYTEAPQGKLGKPTRELCAFAKTKELEPGEQEIIVLSCDRYGLASYDDSGASGHPSAYVLEAGIYNFHLGNCVRSAELVGNFFLLKTELVEQLIPAMSPVVTYERIRPIETKEGFSVGYETTPIRNYNLWDRITDKRPVAFPYTGDMGYRLEDVKNGKVSMQQFVAQIPEKQLCTMLRGEGMNSPKVTPGTGGAFGGLSDELQTFGIPIACCTDGPSGLRMDVGTIAFSIPNGTCFACTFNEALTTELFECMALELRKNKIDVLLGPGMNIHRSPLNGRNFEYYSEDSLLTGKMAAAQLKGMHRHNVTGTIKHFAANNQEHQRQMVNAVVSERALRELYLKGFEIACKEGDAYCVMTTYAPINGIWTASNYDLLTQILRNEWGFTGLVMSDWWAKGNEEGEPGTLREVAAMVRSQNDLHMVTVNAEENTNCDNLQSSLHTEKLTLGELQRGAMNVLHVLMKLPVMERFLGIEDERYQELYVKQQAVNEAEDLPIIRARKTKCIPIEMIDTTAGGRCKCIVEFGNYGNYRATVTLRSKSVSDVAQLSLSVLKDDELLQTITLKGADREWQTYCINFGYIVKVQTKLELFFRQDGIEIQSFIFDI